MSSRDTNRKNSQQLQREADEQINKIGARVDDVRARMSPGALLDDAIFYPHGQSLKSTYGHLKRNPMGTMFLSLGTLLLMEDREHVTYETRFKDSAARTVEHGKDSAARAKENIAHKASELGEKARHKVQETKERMGHKAEELKEEGAQKIDSAKARAKTKTSAMEAKTSKTSHGAKELAREGIERAKESAREVRERARHGLDSARERIGSAGPVGQIHPFAIASLGLGMGATFGASFPMGRIEERFKDPEVHGRIQRLSEEFDDAIRESGERIKNHLIDELKSFNFH